MNGFEPLRRRIIDYTVAGQWSEVYDGPLENCESEKLKAENARLRELVRKVEHYEQLGCHDCPHGGSCDADTLYDERCAMSREIEHEIRELGIEVDI